MKKIILVLIITFILNVPLFANADSNSCENIIAEEYMFPVKKYPAGKVLVTNFRHILCKGNILKIAFDSCFRSEDSKAGDKLSFSIAENLYTQQGTLILPAGTKFIATVINVDKQRFPNKNARIYLKFDKLIFPNCCEQQLSALPCTKDNTLKEGPWMTAGKITASVLSFGIIGTGIGVGFSFIPHPAKIGVGLAAGIPSGTAIGLLSALLSPGLKYHAKLGESIYIILSDNLSLPLFES